MPNTIIREIDKTSPGTETTQQHAVFIPGFSSKQGVTPGTVKLCRTITELESEFGDQPYLFTANQDITYGNQSAVFEGFKEGTPDISYLMAKDLISKGIYVYYDAVNVPGNNVSSMLTLNDSSSESSEKVTIDTTVFGSSSLTAIVTQKFESAGDSGAVSIDLGTLSLPEKQTFTFPATEKNTAGFGNSDYYGFKLTAKKAASSNPISGTYVLDTHDSEEPEFSTGHYTEFTISEVGTYTITLSWNGLATSSIYGEPARKIDLILENAKTYVSDFVKALPDEFEKLQDTEEFDIQYATTGGYPAFEYAADKDVLQKLVRVVATRGDCTLLVDAINDAGRTLITNSEKKLVNVYDSFKSYVENNIVTITKDKRNEDGWTYAPLFYPGGKYNLINAYKDSNEKIISQAIMPASFSYLVNFANALINYPEWYAIAGAARGKLTGTGFISSVVDVPYMTANSWQPKDAVAINPICRVNPYGKLIWGNRTGCDNSANNSSGGDHGSEGGLIATSFLNVRVLSNMVKRLARKAANALMFEPNSDVLWINFKAQLIPTLDQMLSGEGLRRYELVREDTTEKATLKCKIILYPIEAVEFFDITVELADIGSATTSVTIV